MHTEGVWKHREDILFIYYAFFRFIIGAMFLNLEDHCLQNGTLKGISLRVLL